MSPAFLVLNVRLEESAWEESSIMNIGFGLKEIPEGGIEFAVELFLSREILDSSSELNTIKVSVHCHVVRDGFTSSSVKLT